jgi:Eco57I restriction endonuclease.
LRAKAVKKCKKRLKHSSMLLF